MKIKLGIIGAALFALCLIIAVDKSLEKDQIIFVNEVRAWDTSKERDGYYGSDYIEIYNASDEAVSLDGWYLSDDAENLKKNRLTDIVIESGGYLLLYANGTNDTAESLNFKISPLGEKILLSNDQLLLHKPYQIFVPECKYYLSNFPDHWIIKSFLPKD